MSNYKHRDNTEDRPIDPDTGYLQPTVGNELSPKQKAEFIKTLRECMEKDPLSFHPTRVGKQCGITRQSLYDHLAKDKQFYRDYNTLKQAWLDNHEDNIAMQARKNATWSIATLKAHGRRDRWADKNAPEAPKDDRKAFEQIMDRAKKNGYLLDVDPSEG